jgi:hypothetical protein
MEDLWFKAHDTEGRKQLRCEDCSSGGQPVFMEQQYIFSTRQGVDPWRDFVHKDLQRSGMPVRIENRSHMRELMRKNKMDFAPVGKGMPGQEI